MYPSGQLCRFRGTSQAPYAHQTRPFRPGHPNCKDPPTPRSYWFDGLRNQQSCIQYELPCVRSTQSQHQCFTESISLRDVKAPSSPISFRCKRRVSIYCKRSLHIGLHGIAVQIRVVWGAMALIFMGFVIMAECRLRCGCTMVVV